MNKILIIILSFLVLFSNIASAKVLVNDDFIEQHLQDIEIDKPKQNLEYNYLSTIKLPIKIKIETTINSQKELLEGQILYFYVIKDVKYKENILIKAKTLLKARVETIISNGMNGIPASIILGNFDIEGIDSNLLSNEYEKRGLDLSLLVFPLKWALTPLPPSGSLTNFIKGGNAKIKQKEILTIYYYLQKS